MCDLLLSAYNGNIEKYKSLRGLKYENQEIDCLIHAIYHHYDFAKWCKDNIDLTQKIKRAITASFIMNNDLSFINRDNLPYCIWYPKQASEKTYRELYYNYPELKYNIGRACGIAGYNNLYDEMKLLPEVNILAGAEALIRQKILSSDTKYYIMNDYNRICIEPFEINHNYDNTCVNPVNYPKTFINDIATNVVYFDLLENNNIGLHNCSTTNHSSLISSILSDESLELFYIFTYNLPNYLHCNKDILILWSAYNGDIEKYQLLRRPKMITYEYDCLIHAIYHYYEFAKWCKNNLNLDLKIKRAISASFIMNNDLSFIDKDNLPYCIWYPNQALETTYRELYYKCPELKYNIGRACAISGYNDLYDIMGLLPEIHILAEARANTNKYITNKFEKVIKIYNKLNDEDVLSSIDEEYDYSDHVPYYHTAKELDIYYNTSSEIDNYCININDIWGWAVSSNIFENGYVNMKIIKSKIEYIKNKLCPVNKNKIYEYGIIPRYDFIDYNDDLFLGIFD